VSDRPISLSYNLGRLGLAGDEILLEAGEAERAALARFAGIVGVTKFTARIGLKKLAPNRFAVSYGLAADIVQSCVVTLEPLEAAIRRDFSRELHFSPNLRRAGGEGGREEVLLDPEDEDAPEEIESLHYDLAGPLMEEFLLAIDPYPRAPGAMFAPPQGSDTPPENPFAALKRLKSRP